MNTRNDRNLFGMTLALFDHRSGAFRQKMSNHFQSKGRQLWTNIEPFPEGKKNNSVIFSKETA